MVLSTDMLKRILFGTKMWLVKSSWGFRKTLHASPGRVLCSIFYSTFHGRKETENLKGETVSSQQVSTSLTTVLFSASE